MGGWRLGSDDNKSSSNNTGNDILSSKHNMSEKSERKQIQFELSYPRYKIEDLIISKKVHDELQTVIYANTCWNMVFYKWGLSSVMKDKQNLLVNLYGDPGTGKTMAAHAIAHALNQKMICVNYADIESKYVGETGKNLTALFQFAINQHAIIFFDEADALLSRRVTDMSSATDVSVNQTRSVLLTLMNDYKGMIIFATNFISNYDPAFMRRIQYHVKMELPNAQLREKLWRKYIPSSMPNNVNFEQLAAKYSSVSGSDISNAVLKAALYAAKQNSPIVCQEYFERATETILTAKNENNPKVHTETHEVTEEYALSQIS